MSMYEYCLKHSAVADERAEKRDESDKDLLDTARRMRIQSLSELDCLRYNHQ